MAQQELEAALQREGEQKAREFWRAAEAEAEELRRETDRALQRQKDAAAGRLQVETAALYDAAITAARREAQGSRLRAENELAIRLKRLAEERLQTLALAGGGELFQALVGEIPAGPWQEVKVHRRDVQRAQAVFPAAQVVFGEAISAGLQVQSADGRVQIINTLEKRLEKLWPELLPELMEELRRMAGDNDATT